MELANICVVFFFLFSVPVCAITTSEVPGCTLVSTNRLNPVRVISPVTGIKSEGVNMIE
jgi:hypothetical protein